MRINPATYTRLRVKVPPAFGQFREFGQANTAIVPYTGGGNPPPGDTINQNGGGGGGGQQRPSRCPPCSSGVHPAFLIGTATGVTLLIGALFSYLLTLPHLPAQLLTGRDLSVTVSRMGDWQERKTLPGNRAEGNVHLSRNGHVKLDAVITFLGEKWRNDEFSALGGPTKARSVEHGLDLYIRELGHDPMKVLKAGKIDETTKLPSPPAPPTMAGKLRLKGER